jgi:exopolyphosphatase / guanosine-5'-triphosphate,3'-diphosphate pyrophosphatase
MEDPSAAIPASVPCPTGSSERIVAAVDVGTNAIRMVIADVSPDGDIHVLEQFQRAARLGQDTFRQGRLGSQSMRAAVAILREYAQRLGLYDARHVRAVATSAVREASNADTFLDRVFMATGLHLEVIDTSEESRLIVSAVRKCLGGLLDTSQGDALVADVGGGSTLLTVLHYGEIAASQSLRLGSIRLQEVLAMGTETPRRRAELYRRHITQETLSPQRDLLLETIDLFVAVGGDARFAARQVGQPAEADGVRAVPREAYDKLVARCEKMTAEELAAEYDIPFAEAETLNPALAIHQILWRRTRAQTMMVADVSMHDGLLMELAREVTGQEDAGQQQSVIQSALSLANKYQVDVAHAEVVAEIAVRLFDELTVDHGLGSRHRLLLRVAGILHEVGAFVSNRAHHKHSYYLIANSEVFGLSRDEIQIVALVARYHRRSAPRLVHEEYMMAPRPARMIVNKLAALLRVADALARGHVRDATDLKITRAGDELVVQLAHGEDPFLEQRAIAAKGGLFEEIYGLRVRLEQG